MTRKEIWKPVPGFKKLYEVSSEGRVKSLRSNKLLAHYNVNGYPYVDLAKNGQKFGVSVARIVAESFFSSFNRKIDRVLRADKSTDVCVQKLTIKRPALKNGRRARKTPNPRRGCDNPSSKLSQGQVQEIRNSRLTSRALAKKFKTSHTTIGKVRNFKSYINPEDKAPEAE